MSQDERHGSERDLRAIDKVRDVHVAALNSGDATAWVAQFADDGIQMPPNAPANIGKAQIGSWSHAFLNQYRVQFALAVDEVRVLGEWAFDEKPPVGHHSKTSVNRMRHAARAADWTKPTAPGRTHRERMACASRSLPQCPWPGMSPARPAPAEPGSPVATIPVE